PAKTARPDSDGKFALLGLKPGVYPVVVRKFGYAFPKATITVPPPAASPIHFQGQPVPLDEIVSAAGIELQGSQRLTTPRRFRPPVEITVVAKTDSTNLRLAYAADDLVVNWESDPTTLRVNGGPANGKDKKGGGAVPRAK